MVVAGLRIHIQETASSDSCTIHAQSGCHPESIICVSCRSAGEGESALPPKRAGLVWVPPEEARGHGHLTVSGIDSRFDSNPMWTYSDRNGRRRTEVLGIEYGLDTGRPLWTPALQRAFRQSRVGIPKALAGLKPPAV